MEKTSNKLIELKDILFIWRLFTKNFLIILLVPVLSYMIGYVYTYRLPNVYGSSCQLLLKSNDTYDYQESIYKGLGAYGIYTDTQNHMRMLTSKDIIGEVVDRMNIEVSYFGIAFIKIYLGSKKKSNSTPNELKTT